MSKQVWDSKIHLLLGEAIYTHLYVYVDPAKVHGAQLADAFTFQADVRAAGAVLFSTGRIPLKNGPIKASPTVSDGATLGTVEGEIDDWNFTHQSWAATNGVRFLVVAKSDVSIPIKEIVRLVPGFGELIKGVLSLFGKVRVTVGHETVLIPIGRDGSGKVVSVNHVKIA
jgi:hypothetical protein